MERARRGRRENGARRRRRRRWRRETRRRRRGWRFSAPRRRRTRDRTRPHPRVWIMSSCGASSSGGRRRARPGMRRRGRRARRRCAPSSFIRCTPRARLACSPSAGTRERRAGRNVASMRMTTTTTTTTTTRNRRRLAPSPPRGRRRRLFAKSSNAWPRRRPVTVTSSRYVSRRGSRERCVRWMTRARPRRKRTPRHCSWGYSNPSRAPLSSRIRRGRRLEENENSPPPTPSRTRSCVYYARRPTTRCIHPSTRTARWRRASRPSSPRRRLARRRRLTRRAVGRTSSTPSPR